MSVASAAGGGQQAGRLLTCNLFSFLVGTVLLSGVSRSKDLWSGWKSSVCVLQVDVGAAVLGVGGGRLWTCFERGWQINEISSEN